MKFLVIVVGLLSLAAARPQYAYDDYPIYKGPSAPIGHDGRVVDTPEVSQAKAAHLAAYDKMAARASSYDESIEEADSAESYEEDRSNNNYAAAPYSSNSIPSQFSSQIRHYNNPVYQGPPAPLDHEGRVIDTPEVAQLKAAHFAAYNNAASQAKAPRLYLPYTNPGHLGYAPLAHDGRVVDTPEVANAKAAHLAAHAKALSQARGPAYYNNY